MRSDKQKTGDFGERLAQEYLEKQGFKCIATNWLCRAGEIDLVMQDGPTRVMVEVRLRQPTQYGRGEETVSWQKQAKLKRAAQFYQMKCDYWGDLRFDVVSVTQAPGQPPIINHIPHAFTA